MCFVRINKSGQKREPFTLLQIINTHPSILSPLLVWVQITAAAG